MSVERKIRSFVHWFAHAIPPAAAAFCSHTGWRSAQPIIFAEDELSGLWEGAIAVGPRWEAQSYEREEVLNCWKRARSGWGN